MLQKSENYYEFRIPYRRVTFIASDKLVDLALLSNEDGNPDVVATFRSQPVKVAEDTGVFGYPVSQELSYAGNFTSGVVSGLSGPIHGSQYDNRFRHTAPITPGNSGGPVFDSSGNVVGVNVEVQFSTYPLELSNYVDFINIAQNINFAIKFKAIRDFIDDANLRDRDIDYEVIGSRGWVDTENLDKSIPLEEIYDRAQKFTVPVIRWKNKGKEPLVVIETGIDELDSRP